MSAADSCQCPCQTSIAVQTVSLSPPMSAAALIRAPITVSLLRPSNLVCESPTIHSNRSGALSRRRRQPRLPQPHARQRNRLSRPPRTRHLRKGRTWSRRPRRASTQLPRRTAAQSLLLGPRRARRQLKRARRQLRGPGRRRGRRSRRPTSTGGPLPRLRTPYIGCAAGHRPPVAAPLGRRRSRPPRIQTSSDMTWTRIAICYSSWTPWQSAVTTAVPIFRSMAFRLKRGLRPGG